MKYLNLGSLNIDYVYQVDHFVQPGETLAATGRQTYCGGKGLNQSVALAKAGGEVYHGGMVGKGGEILLQKLQEAGADLSLVQKEQMENGHTIIQIDKQGQNCILLYGGTNTALTREYVDKALEPFAAGDVFLTQNETNQVDYMLKKASQKGMVVTFNGAPMTEQVKGYPLELVNILLINEVEGQMLTGQQEEQRQLDWISSKYPNMDVVLTVGARGAWYSGREGRFAIGVFPVKPVDTTGAGDTFVGYYLQSIASGLDVKEAMVKASAASALAIGKKGAANAIPWEIEVEEALQSGQLGQIQEVG